MAAHSEPPPPTRAPKSAETGLKMAASICMHAPERVHVASRTPACIPGAVTWPPHSLFGANLNAPVCAQLVAVVVGVIAAAGVRIAVDRDAIRRPVAVWPRSIAVGIA